VSPGPERTPTLGDLDREQRAAAWRFRAAVRERFPADMRVRVRHGEHLSFCDVLETSGERVRVRSDRGAVYWVSVFRLVEFDHVPLPPAPESETTS
jgi:hypothetical protein